MITSIISVLFLLTKMSFAGDYHLFDSPQTQNLDNSSLMKSLSNLWLSVRGSPRTPSPKLEDVKRNIEPASRGAGYSNEIFIESEGSNSPRNMSHETYTSFPSTDKTLVDPNGLLTALFNQQYTRSDNNDDDQLSRSSSGSEGSFHTIFSQGVPCGAGSLGKNNSKETFEEDKSNCCCCPWFFYRTK